MAQRSQATTLAAVTPETVLSPGTTARRKQVLGELTCDFRCDNMACLLAQPPPRAPPLRRERVLRFREVVALQCTVCGKQEQATAFF